MKTFIQKIQTRFSKFGEYISAKDLLIIATLLLVESCLFIGVVEYRKSLETNPVRIKCNDRTINQPMAPEAQTNWIPYLFAAGILLWCSMSIGHTIFAMKNQDYESQTGILNGVRKNVPMIRLVRWFGVLTIGLFLMVLITLPWSYYMGELAPNFISACKPAQLDLLCHCPYDRRSVDVVCTTPAELWFPSRSSFLPTSVTLQSYLMLTSLFFVIVHMSWSGAMRYMNSFSMLLCVLLSWGVGYSAVQRNEADWINTVFGFFIGMISSFFSVMLNARWMNWDVEQKLPRNWNDVPPTTQNPLLSRNKGNGQELSTSWEYLPNPSSVH
jgi:hypothetical protein